MNYYPIGTVVTLKNGNRPIMIYGRKQIQQNTNRQWDYVACLYPEGNLGDKYNIFFQHEEIDEVYHKGYESVMDLQMQKILNKQKN